MRQYDITIADATLNVVSRRFRRSGSNTVLYPKENHLFCYLWTRRGEIVSKAELYKEIWGMHFIPESNTVGVHISRLRDKIDRGHQCQLLHTTVGGGYVLSERYPITAVPWIYDRRTP